MILGGLLGGWLCTVTTDLTYASLGGIVALIVAALFVAGEDGILKSPARGGSYEVPTNCYIG